MHQSLKRVLICITQVGKVCTLSMETSSMMLKWMKVLVKMLNWSRSKSKS